MLVLTRKKGEQVIIDGDIKIHVLQVNKDKVKLGFEDPQKRRVDRLEIHEKRQCSATTEAKPK
jgi:carbon storage regulator